MEENWKQMKRGEWYDAADPALVAKRDQCHALLQEYNALHPADGQAREALLRRIVDAKGKLCIEQPFWCDYGCNIHLGHDFFANFNFTVLDGGDVVIGDRVYIGPGVGIYTAIHPFDPHVRGTDLERTAAVEIGDDVWIGGGCQIVPGVRIGNRSVIGAGSVVTKDIPSDVVAAGNPCRVIRSLKEAVQKEQDETRQP